MSAPAVFLVRDDLGGRRRDEVEEKNAVRYMFAYLLR